METNVTTVQPEEKEIDLVELLYVLWDKIAFILFAVVALGAVGFLYSKFIVTPMYQSNSMVYVLNRTNEGTVTSSDISSSTALTNDFRYLATSHLVVDQVLASLELSDTYSYQKMCSEIGVEILNDSRMLKLTVTDSDAYRAKQIADKLAEIMVTNVKESMNIEANVIDYGLVPTSPSSPNIYKNSIICALIGLVLSVGVIVVIFLLDDTIKTENDIEKHLHLPVLAVIPLGEDEEAGKSRKNKKRRR